VCDEPVVVHAVEHVDVRDARYRADDLGGPPPSSTGAAGKVW
jgi:hypothetical protein